MLGPACGSLQALDEEADVPQTLQIGRWGDLQWLSLVWMSPGKPHLMVGVVLGVGGPLSRLRWLWTGLCAGGMSGLRAGSLREKSDTALCTGGEREKRGQHGSQLLLT